MANWRMTVYPYRGDLWQRGKVHPELGDLLLRKDLLVEITSGPGPFQVILGVPHHAAPGVNRIAEDWRDDRRDQFGRAADEFSGLTGLAFFEALRELGIACKLVIACHATDHDPNKTPGSPYWQSVFASTDGAHPSNPPLLFELHGSGRERMHALELSAGRNKITDPTLFGKALAYFYTGPETIACQARPGSSEAWILENQRERRGRLEMAALQTHSLSHAGSLGMHALHLEMKAAFRRPERVSSGRAPSFSPPAPAWQLARAAASAVRMLSRPDDVRIPAADFGLASAAFLTRPSHEYQASYLEAVRETPVEELRDNPELRVSTPSEFTNLVVGTRPVNYYGLPHDPPEEYLWLIDGGQFIGRAFFLHWLNPFRLQTDGQVDYWIRPSRRRMGYGTLILRLLLERYRQLGLTRVLVTCLETNLPSQKVILANGGQFESRIETPDWDGIPRPRLRYWIDLPPR